MFVVKLKEEDGEAQGDVLLWGATEGTPQKFHAGHGEEKSSAAGVGLGAEREKKVRIMANLSLKKKKKRMQD